MYTEYSVAALVEALREPDVLTAQADMERDIRNFAVLEINCENLSAEELLAATARLAGRMVVNIADTVGMTPHALLSSILEAFSEDEPGDEDGDDAEDGDPETDPV